MAYVEYGSEFMISRSTMLALRRVVTIHLLLMTAVAAADSGCGGEVTNGQR